MCDLCHLRSACVWPSLPWRVVVIHIPCVLINHNLVRNTSNSVHVEWGRKYADTNSKRQCRGNLAGERLHPTTDAAAR